MIATNQAQEILDKATEDANNIRTAAIEYTDNLLGNLENIVTHAIDTSKAKYDSLLSSLQNCQEIVLANRAELKPEADEENSDGSGDGEKEAEDQDEISIIASKSEE